MRISKDALPRYRQLEHELWHLQVLLKYSRHRELELIGRRAPAWMINRYDEDVVELMYEIDMCEAEMGALVMHSRQGGRRA